MEKLLAPGDQAILCTTKPDKYDCYLADVFVRAGASPNSDRTSSLSEPRDAFFLINALLSARRDPLRWRREGGVDSFVTGHCHDSKP